MLTAYKEMDPETGKKKVITLIEEFDDQLDIAIGDLLLIQL